MRDKMNVIYNLVDICLEHNNNLRESLCELKDYCKLTNYTMNLIKVIQNSLDILDLSLTDIMYTEREYEQRKDT